MKTLDGKVAVVTGAASGIGLSLSEAFVAADMKVVMADVEVEPLVAQAQRLEAAGHDVLAVTCDVSDFASVEHLRDETVREFGTAHVICNNAGVAPGGPIMESTASDWDWVLGVNVSGVAYGVIAFGPILQEQNEGHFVNTASMAGHVTTQRLGAYCASKHAVVGLSEALYRETEGSGVGVSVLCPEFVKTAIFESERNRPNPSAPTAQQQADIGFLKEVVMETAISPDKVATDVVSAIKNDEFWIFTHEGSRETCGRRNDDIQGGRNPTPWPASPD